MSKNTQYITNANGDRVAVIIPIREFESMLAEIGLTLDDYKKEPSDPLRTVLDRLRSAGEIEI